MLCIDICIVNSTDTFAIRCALCIQFRVVVILHINFSMGYYSISNSIFHFGLFDRPSTNHSTRVYSQTTIFEQKMQHRVFRVCPRTRCRPAGLYYFRCRTQFVYAKTNDAMHDAKLFLFPQKFKCTARTARHRRKKYKSITTTNSQTIS